MQAMSPETLGGSPITIMLYVENVDEVFAQAVAAGAKVQRPLADQFYGDRTGGVTDPFGHKWDAATDRRRRACTDELAKVAFASYAKRTPGRRGQVSLQRAAKKDRGLESEQRSREGS